MIKLYELFLLEQIFITVVYTTKNKNFFHHLLYIISKTSLSNGMELIEIMEIMNVINFNYNFMIPNVHICAFKKRTYFK